MLYLIQTIGLNCYSHKQKKYDQGTWHLAKAHVIMTQWKKASKIFVGNRQMLVASTFFFSKNISNAFFFYSHKSFPKPLFICVCSKSLLKTLWEKEKFLVTSNFSFFHSVFYPFGELFAIFIKRKILVFKLSSLVESKIVILERVKPWDCVVTTSCAPDVICCLEMFFKMDQPKYLLSTKDE